MRLKFEISESFNALEFTSSTNFSLGDKFFPVLFPGGDGGFVAIFEGVAESEGAGNIFDFGDIGFALVSFDESEREVRRSGGSCSGGGGTFDETTFGSGFG